MKYISKIIFFFILLISASTYSEEPLLQAPPSFQLLSKTSKVMLSGELIETGVNRTEATYFILRNYFDSERCLVINDSFQKKFRKQKDGSWVHESKIETLCSLKKKYILRHGKESISLDSEISEIRNKNPAGCKNLKIGLLNSYEATTTPLKFEIGKCQHITLSNGGNYHEL